MINMKRYGIIGVLGIVLLVVAMSGCTSNTPTNTTGYQTDIVLDGDTSGNITGGQWNTDGNTQWASDGGNIVSKSNTEYTNITLLFTAYNKKGKVVGKKKVTTYLDSSGMSNVNPVIIVNGTPAYVMMTVVNATAK